MPKRPQPKSTRRKSPRRHPPAREAREPAIDGNVFELEDRKGTRQILRELGEALVSELASDFAEHGRNVIAAVRERRPADYLKLVTSLVAKQDSSAPDYVVGHVVFNGLNDAETLARLSEAQASDPPTQPLLPGPSEHWRASRNPKN